MTLQANTLRPGLLVSLKTSVAGGVEYQRVDIETGKPLTSGAKVDRWETTKIVQDPTEYEAAVKLRSRCRNIVSRVCIETDFGLLCPAQNEARLEAAIVEARAEAQAFNATARLSTVGVWMITGRVAQDDAEAVRALSQELTGLFDAMERGIKAADPEAIRQAAKQARDIGGMLTPDAAGKVNEAVKQAREAASTIVKRVIKDGEAAATVAEQVKVDALKRARFAFLDLDTEASTAPVDHQGRQVDLSLAEPAPEKPAAAPRDLDVEPAEVRQTSPATAALAAWDLV